MSVKVYVEGGGDHNKALESECRRGFSKFFERAGLKDRLPRVVRCGSRQQAYERFRTAQESRSQDELPVLLIDSEGPLTQRSKWEDARLRRPQGASEDQLHLMVQAMEAWFHADRDALERYYGDGFRPGSLSQRTSIEDVPRADLFNGLARATKDCTKGEYSKGQHSFQILAEVDPAKVRAACPHAELLLTYLDSVCA